MINENEIKFIKQKIQNLRASKIHYRDAEGKGYIEGKIQVLKDILDGKPALEEMTDEELEQEYQKYSKSSLIGKLGFSDTDYHKKKYLRDRIYEEQKRRDLVKEKEKLKNIEVNSSVFSKEDLIKHGIIPTANNEAPPQKETNSIEDQRKKELAEYVAALYREYYKIASSTGNMKTIHGKKILPAFRGYEFSGADADYLNDYEYYVDSFGVLQQYRTPSDLSLDEFRQLKNPADADEIQNNVAGRFVCAIKKTYDELAQNFINCALSYKGSDAKGIYTRKFYVTLSNAFYNDASTEELKNMIKDYFLTILKLPRNPYGD